MNYLQYNSEIKETFIKMETGIYSYLPGNMERIFDFRNLGAAFSLANLWFISQWKELVFQRYFDFAPHSIFEYLAVFLNVSFLTFFFLILLYLGNRLSDQRLGRICRFIFLFLGFLAFSAPGSEIIKWVSPKTVNFVNLPLPIIVAFFCVLFALKQKPVIDAVRKNLRLAGLLLFPFSLLIFIQLLWTGLIAEPAALQPQAIEKDFAANRKSKLSTKVVWIIFDETDYAALTTAKQNNTELPDIERLISQSFTAQNAFPPNDVTLRSIPSLLTGKIVRNAVPAAANDLNLALADSAETMTLRQSSNIVKEVRALEGETGIIGFYHPYPRIFEGQTAYAFGRGLAPLCSTLMKFANCAVKIFVSSLLNIPFVARFFPSLWKFNFRFSQDEHEWQIGRHHFLTEKAKELVSKPELNLLFFHFSIPHQPFIGRTNLHGKETYFNSLEVVNDTLKQLRTKLEDSGQWKETTLILSSDHWWRFKELKDFNYLPEEERQKALKDTRIPFIVKFAGQKTRIDYKPPLNTVITKELILAILKNEIKNPEELIIWLDNMRRLNPDLINRHTEIGGDWGERW